MSSTFKEVLQTYSSSWILQTIQSSTPTQVEVALSRAARAQRLTPEHFLALLSPGAQPYIEEMAQISMRITQQRFGKVIQMYVPLYLSNECLCDCTYCGYSKVNQITRLTLNKDQILKECDFLCQQGFRHILLLSGEDARYVNSRTLCETVQWIRPIFSSISIEVQPMKVEEYARLVESGVDGVTVYQETYNQDAYQKVHLAGRKKVYDYRLETPERAATAGVRRINIGALLGLSDWQYDGFCVGLHAWFLEKKYWRSQFSISLPRIREATGLAADYQGVSDPIFVQLMTALRLFLPNIGITLSTRETARFRDHVFPLGVTQMSAGSRTTPGGYIEENHSGAQFEVEDRRSPNEVVRMIQQRGYEAVWKDWDPSFLGEPIPIEKSA